MKPSEIFQLSAGAPIWVWIVRLGKGRWWPGTVESLKVIDGLPQVTVRFESRGPERRNSHSAAVFMGISTTRMRFLERRDLADKGEDRPHHTPVPLLRTPETRIQRLVAIEPENSTSKGEAGSAR